MKCEKDRIVIWKQWLFGLSAIFPVIMIVALFISLPDLTGKPAGTKTLMIGFTMLWFFGMSALAGYLLFCSCQTVIIDRRGVRRLSPFRSLELRWSEIGDWGIVPEGNRQHSLRNQAGSIFFSREVLEQNALGKRKFRGELIRIVVYDLDNPKIWQKLLPLCESRSMIKPKLQ